VPRLALACFFSFSSALCSGRVQSSPQQVSLSLSLSLPIGAVVIVESDERNGKVATMPRDVHGIVALIFLRTYHTITPHYITPHYITLHHTMPYRSDALFECSLPRNLAVAPGCVVISIQVLPVIVPFRSVWFGLVWFGLVQFRFGTIHSRW